MRRPHFVNDEPATDLDDYAPSGVLRLYVIAIGITIYFWRINIIGIHESSSKAMRIMQLTTIMGVIVIAWASLTLWSTIRRC